MRLEGLVTHTFPLEQVNEAIAALRSGEAARVMLRMREKWEKMEIQEENLSAHSILTSRAERTTLVT